MSEGAIQPSKKICFAVLVHNKREVVLDMLDNIRVHCPNSSIVLFNGGLDPHLCDNLGYPVCPTSRKLKYGLTATYYLEVMEWLEQLDFPYDYLINLDSDSLFLRNGYETFIEEAMRDSDYMGVDVFYRNKSWICGKHLKKEWGMWKKLLLSDKFLGAFNVGQVISRRFVTQLLSWEKFGRLKHNLRITKAFGLDEIVYVMIAKRFGLKPRSYPRETGRSIRYRPYYRYQEVIKLMNKNSHSYLLHPVTRKMNDQARILIRDLTRKAWKKYLPAEIHAPEVHGSPEILRTGNKLQVVAPVSQGGFGHWTNSRDTTNSRWDGPVTFGSGKWVAFSMIRGSVYGNLEMIGRKEDRLIHIWRDEKSKEWNKTVCIAKGVHGSPCLTENQQGHFQLIAPLKKGGIGFWWRNNTDSQHPWFGPAIISQRQMDVVSLFNTANKRVVAVVAGDGRLFSYIRHNGAWRIGVTH
jgi:hypothetical protein